MDLLLLIYLIGCFCALSFFIVTIVDEWEGGSDVMLSDVLVALCMTIGSWCSFVTCLVADWASDVVLFKGRKERR